MNAKRIKRGAFNALVNNMDRAETAAAEMGLFESMRAINAAKNKLGWEYAERLKKEIKA